MCAHGAPTCTQEQIDDRLAICNSCERFNGSVCSLCGCPVNREQRFRNKLAWADQRCPLGKWPAIAPTAIDEADNHE